MKRRFHGGFTLIELLTSMFIISTIIAIFIPNLRRAVFKTEYVSCKTNLRNIATALSLYSNDNDSQYPPTLDGLTPDYMKSLPLCHTHELQYGYDRATAPAQFTVYCAGNNHPLFAQPDEPYYNSAVGLFPTD